MNIGDTIDNKYHIQEEIGQGGFGKVYRVQYNQQTFAAKICVESDVESVRRFKREVRLMAAIKHENVIEILDMNLDYEPPYFIMPLCKYSLDKKISKLQQRPELSIKIMLNVCKGIGAVHSSGVIHRDIKPQNILISHENQVKITDLGLGKFDNRDSTILTSSNIYMGTHGYIPPEFLKTGGTKNADVRSDIYQLGKTLYNVFTDSNPVLIEKDKLTGGLLYILNKCVSENPDDRYKSVGELESALDNYLLSLNPQNNPLNAFENYINVAKENLRNRTYDKENIEDIVKTIFTFSPDPEVFFNKVKQIPKTLLEVIASNFPNLCKDFLDIYTSTIQRYFKESRIDFSDAEDVANAMIKVFKGSSDIATKIEAMEITLFAAVYCNRYAAMEVFDTMIQSIKNDQDAVAVCEMLRTMKDYYANIADRVPPLRLHHLIQKIQKEIAEEKSELKAKQQRELDEIDY